MSERKRLCQNLIAVITAYRAVHAIAESTVGRVFFTDSTFVGKLQGPAGVNFTIDRYEVAMARFSLKWPDGAVWPPNVDRPSLREAERIAGEG